MANSFLEPQGLYNPSLRFAFTNITDENFTSYYDKVPITVKPHETIEISISTPIVGAGHQLAIKMTGELVDKIMIGEAKMDETNNKNALNPYYRSPKGTSLGVPQARKVWEDQILRELAPDEESPAIQQMRNQMKKELLGDVEKKAEQTEPMKIPSSIEDFAQLRTDKPQEVVKQPAKVKKIKNETTKSATTKAE